MAGSIEVRVVKVEHQPGYHDRRSTAKTGNESGHKEGARIDAHIHECREHSTDTGL